MKFFQLVIFGLLAATIMAAPACNKTTQARNAGARPSTVAGNVDANRPPRTPTPSGNTGAQGPRGSGPRPTAPARPGTRSPPPPRKSTVAGNVAASRPPRTPTPSGNTGAKGPRGSGPRPTAPARTGARKPSCSAPRV